MIATSAFCDFTELYGSLRTPLEAGQTVLTVMQPTGTTFVESNITNGTHLDTKTAPVTGLRRPELNVGGLNLLHSPVIDKFG